MKKLSLLEVLEGIEDTRRNLSVQYPLHEVLFMLLVAVICGATSYVKVEMFAKSLDSDTLVQVVGSADTKTGTETRNFALAQNRANVVKNVLVNEYGVAADRITVNTKIDATDNVETSRSAILTLSVE